MKTILKSILQGQIQFAPTAAVILLITLVACTKEIENTIPGEATNTETTIKAIVPGTDTRIIYDDQVDDDGVGTVSATWKTGDRITIVNTESKEEKVFRLTNGGNTQEGIFSGVMPEYGEESDLMAYHPTRTVDFTTQTQTGNGSTQHLTAYHVMQGSISEGVVTFEPKYALMRMHLELPTEFVANEETAKSITLNTNSSNAFFTVYSDTLQTPGSSVNLKLNQVTPSDGLIDAYIMVAPNQPIATDCVINIILETDGNSYLFTSEALQAEKEYEPGKMYVASVTSDQWTISSTFNNAVAALSLEQITENYEGEGTTDDPYLISSARLLRKLILETSTDPKEPYAGKFFKLTTDIHITTDIWTPLGSYFHQSNTSPFRGNFDGDNHKITGTLKGGDYLGFFGYIDFPTSTITIKNLIVEADVISTGNYVGGVAGYVYNPTGSSPNFIIDNCHFTGTIRAEFHIGGIVGHVEANPSFSVTVRNCTSRGVVEGNGVSNYSLVGGIAGMVSNNAWIRNCTNYAYVTGKSAHGYIGGIVGKTGYYVTYCINYGTVDGESGLGGIVGNGSGTTPILENNTNYGAIGNSNAINVGGIIGTASSRFGYSNNVNHSLIILGKSYVGGIWGNVSSYSDDGGNRNNNPAVPRQGVE